MLVLILSKDATNQFAAWNRMAAMIPMGAERDSTRDLDRQRYYRLVLPMEPDKPPLSSHPLTWTTISHVVWDGLPPDVLSVSQQQAILDWLHWGGQLIFTGGAGQSYAIYHDSFLGPYLPADADRADDRPDPGGPEAALAVLSATHGAGPTPQRRFRTGLPGQPGIRARLSGAGPDLGGAGQAGVPVGAPPGCGCVDHPAGRGEPPPPGRRDAGSVAGGSPC